MVAIYCLLVAERYFMLRVYANVDVDGYRTAAGVGGVCATIQPFQAQVVIGVRGFL